MIAGKPYGEPGDDITINPTLEPSLTRMQQPRFTATDTNWNVKTPHEDWEKQYEIKFKDIKRNRRRF